MLFDLLTEAWGQDPNADEITTEEDDGFLGDALEYPEPADDEEALEATGSGDSGDAHAVDVELNELAMQMAILQNLSCHGAVHALNCCVFNLGADFTYAPSLQECP